MKRASSRRGGRARILAPVLLVIILGASSLEAQEFLRGDANSDGRLSGSDAHFLLSFLFFGRSEPQCLSAADTDGDGRINITDAIAILSHLVLGGLAPCAPFPEPGEGNPDGLPCGDIAIRPPLENPEDQMRVSNAIAGPAGRTILNLFVTNSTDIAGYFATIRMDGRDSARRPR